MKRIVFSFDETSLASTNALKAKMGVETLGDVVKESLSVLLKIHELADEGFTEVVVRKSGGGFFGTVDHERVLAIPSLDRRFCPGCGRVHK